MISKSPDPNDDEPLDDLAVAELAAFDEQLAGSDLIGDPSTGRGAVVESDPSTTDNLAAAKRTLVLLERLRRSSADRSVKQGSAQSFVDSPRAAGATGAAGAAASGGHSFGRFEIERELGRGAFGVVFLARDPVLRRAVALKLPRPEVLVDDSLRRRFLREAEATARLTHPNIVPVYETGESGLVVYIVSAYCAGMTLGSWLAQRSEPVAAKTAVAILMPLAEAVDYAHHQGVIHRDIKPGNVMLERGVDGRPYGSADLKLGFTPRLTDFGLARLVEAEGTGTAGVVPGSGSRSGAVVGTPAYMAPEQAKGQVRAIGPASDVYALGAVLYELLTKRRPIAGDSDADTLRRVVSEEPVAPRRILPSIPRDLEAICLKCLEKEPGKRYASAGALAEDLRRFGAALPTLARPLGPIGRSWRWAKKSPVLAALTGTTTALLLLLALGATLAAWRISEALALANETAIREREQRGRAEEAEKAALSSAADAQRKANDARQVSDFLVGLFQSSDPVGLEGYGFRRANEAARALSAIELLDRGRERIRTAMRDQPLDRAALLDTLGMVYRSMGRLDEAEPLLTESLDIRRKSFPAPHADLASSLVHNGWFHHDRGRLKAAQECLREALSMQRALFGEESLELATAKLHLGWVIADDVSIPNRLTEAETLLQQSLKTRRDLLGDGHRQVAVSLTALASVYLSAGQYDKAKTLGINSLLTLASHDDGRVLFRALSEYQAGVAQRRLKRFDEALQNYSGAIADLEGYLGDEHPASIMLRGDRAGLLKEMGRFGEAEAEARAVIAAGTRLSPGGHPMLVRAIKELAWVQANRGEHGEALALFQQALTMLENIHGREHGEVALCRSDIGVVQRYQGDFARAIANQVDAVALARSASSGAVYEIVTLQALAETYMEAGETARAEETFDQAGLAAQAGVAADSRLGGYPRVLKVRRLGFLHYSGRLTDEKRAWVLADSEEHSKEGFPPGERADACLFLARLRLDEGRAAEAMDLARTALELREKHLPDRDWQIAEARAALGMAQVAEGDAKAGAAARDATEGEANLLAGYEALKRIRGLDFPPTEAARRALVEHFEKAGRPEEAAKFRSAASERSGKALPKAG